MRYNYNSSGYVFTDEPHSNIGSGVLILNHDCFWGDSTFVVRTAVAGGGILLIKGTDYTLGGAYTARDGTQLFSNVTILNGAYQTVTLYFSGKYAGDFDSATVINSILGGWFLSFNNFQSPILKVTSNTAILVTSSNNPFSGAGIINLNINTGSFGAGGLDTGSIAASSWYSVWDIYNPTTQATSGIMALMPVLAGNVTSGSNVVTNLSSTASMAVGMPVGSIYFPAGTIVTSIDSSTQIHVSNNALATQTGASIIFMYNPVMPSGYSIKIRVGTALTDSSKYLMRVNYNEKDAQYIETAGSNTTVLPTIASGALGSVSPLTFAACSLMGLVPPTASRIRGNLLNTGESGGVIIATNNNFLNYNSTTNPPPAGLSNATGQQTELPFDFMLESMYLYYIASASGEAAFCFGWKDNL